MEQQNFTAVIYARVSTDEQTRGESLDIQAERCQTLCTARGWPVYKHCSDPGFSGDTIGRPDFTEMLQATAE